MSIRIREYSESDWSAVWEMMEPVIRSGESYPYAMDMDADGAHYMWVEKTDSVYVVEEDSGTCSGLTTSSRTNRRSGHTWPTAVTWWRSEPEVRELAL